MVEKGVSFDEPLLSEFPSSNSTTASVVVRTAGRSVLDDWTMTKVTSSKIVLDPQKLPPAEAVLACFGSRPFKLS